MRKRAYTTAGTACGSFRRSNIERNQLHQRFTKHDLRAKCVSGAESLEHTRALLSHSDAHITEAIYRRKSGRVKPLNSKRGGE
ncbi:hypothetical protein SAMN05216412_101464 [Nitrosospira multiformis]|uniref:Phage integrase family protein n=1 Tax=Nitrosospira multiformis TaxID=1231 RepID=A0A1H9Z188_9PROT|nr:hypothetical protein SAMN05216412_101464 [Nitrosospira multiformis]